MALKREAHDLAQAYLFLIREGFCARQSIVVDSGAVLVRRRPVAAAGSALASQGAGMAAARMSSTGRLAVHHGPLFAGLREGTMGVSSTILNAIPGGETMNCSELMKTDVACCKASEPVEKIAELMQARNIGFVPVCRDDGTVIGTLTDRDLAIRVLAEHRSASSTRAEDVMTREVVYCKPDEELSVAERLMSAHKKSRIVCVDDQKHPVGVISLSDIAARDGGARSSELLSSISEREARA